MVRLPLLRRWLLVGLAMSCVCGILACSGAGVSSSDQEVAIELTTGGMAELQQIVDDSQGKVVLVDFWATWCSPCRKQFPHTVELHEQYADDGLVVVSVSMDDSEDPEIREQVLGFLTKMGAGFSNLISRHGDSQQAFEEFDISALPHYVLFDRDGKRHDLTSPDPAKPVTTEILDQRVAEYLDR
ncbi:MAG: TlpA family protein disulfide reductase [Planctomycetota bacterium]|nr:MAG: TlpA family protein disulfide reductase [Planctomycetota bacterium]REJ89951.1 MAG: TlpA family protein disulfide reductase [Planctomycetota bacterium]REK28183.1 MAG: TlpA family protein disulfide reductase [Planctomycetota bacterium]REK42441.1 MAG: TlpA family protein disulfide reductase [Planctomycetota bacterium]